MNIKNKRVVAGASSLIGLALLSRAKADILTISGIGSESEYAASIYNFIYATDTTGGPWADGWDGTLSNYPDFGFVGSFGYIDFHDNNGTDGLRWTDGLLSLGDTVGGSTSFLADGTYSMLGEYGTVAPETVYVGFESSAGYGWLELLATQVGDNPGTGDPIHTLEIVAGQFSNAGESLTVGTPIPEPSTSFLLMGSLVYACFCRRIKRRR